MEHTLQPYRPNIGEPYKKIVLKMTNHFNKTAMPMYHYRDIHIVRMALEDLYKRMFPGEDLPPDVLKLHKRFYADLDLEPSPKVYTPLKS